MRLDDRKKSVMRLNQDGASSALLVCEHASNHIPAAYGGLGLTDAVLRSHIAWDPGALGVARGLSRLLDAELIAAAHSRLLYDCNRAPDRPDAIVEKSEIYDVPGNVGLGAHDRQDRVDRFYHPFAEAVGAAVSRRAALITIHSFTPVYHGAPRAVEVGVIHDTDTRLADAVLEQAAAHLTLKTLRNEPYAPDDGVTHTLCEHGIRGGVPNVMIEIRNDLIASEDDQVRMAERLAPVFTAALAQVVPEHGEVRAS